MADYNQVFNRSYSEMVQALLRIQEGPGLTELQEQLTAALVLEVERPEWYLLRGVHRFSSFVTSAAAPGNLSFVQLGLPSTARCLVVIESARNNVAQLVDVRDGSNVIGGGSSGRVLDTRDVSGSTALIITGNAAAATGTVFDRANGMGGATGPFPDFAALPGYVLSPGKVLTFWGQTANTVVVMTLRWLERPASEQELQIG